MERIEKEMQEKRQAEIEKLKEQYMAQLGEEKKKLLELELEMEKKERE